MSSDTPFPPPEQPPAAPTAAPVDTRPKRLALTSLIFAGVGLVFAVLGFLPVPVVGLALVLVGGILLLAGLIIAIVALVSKRQGGTGLAIAGLAVSLAGGIIWVFALLAAILWTGIAAATSDRIPAPTPTSSISTPAPASPSATTPAPDAPVATTGEAAYLAAVRPQLTALFIEAQPGANEEQIDAALTDETLVALGQTFAQIDETNREALRTQYISSAAGQFTPEQAGRFFDTIYDASQQYLR